MKFVCSDCIEEDITNLSLAPNREPGRVQVEISSHKYFGYPDSQEHQMLHCQANVDLERVKT